jgi:hypothetical protein
MESELLMKLFRRQKEYPQSLPAVKMDGSSALWMPKDWRFWNYANHSRIRLLPIDL